MQVDASNSRFEKAVSIVNHTNRHLFLTGKAGTGKTTFLKYIRDHTFKKLAVVAPTGVAAINAGGVTIHSFFQLPFGTFIANQSSGWNETNNKVYNTHQLLGKLRIHKKKRNLIRELDMLIIDEVSMVRADVLDAVDMVLRHIRRRHHEPFGGLQMVYIGDLFQLPPVVKDEEWQLMQSVYEGPFFFHAQAIREMSPIYLELTKIYRQDDPVFIALLNNIRNNCCEPEELEQLEDYYQPDFIPDQEDGYITLTSHNYLADRINERELNKLSGKKLSLKAVIEGEFPQSAFPADNILEIKEGAQIMFIKNDKGEDRRYFNGKTGIVQEINTQKEKIYIRFPNEENLLELSKETWRNLRYQYDEEKDEVSEKEIGAFKQFPLRLAWAVTIHKSQGLTFNKAIIDAGRAFAAGQVYVALSRLTCLKGLVLHSKITSFSIRTNEQVLQFAARQLPEDELQEMLDQAQDEFLHKSVLSAFQWDKLLLRLDKYREETDNGTTATKLIESGLVNTLKNSLLEEQKVGFKFIPVMEKLLQGKTTYQRLNERTQAAAEWFAKDLEEKIIGKINNQIKELKAKPRTKKKVRDLQNLLRAFLEKKKQLEQAVIITSALCKNEARGTLIQAATEMFHSKVSLPDDGTTAKATKPVKGATKRISLSLFKEGKSPEEIAVMRELKEGTIVNHLISFIPTGEIQLEELFDKKTITALLPVIEENPEAPSSEIRELTDEQYSYPAIKAVQAQARKKKTVSE